MIKWVGGKRALLPLLCDAWHDQPYKRLVEPFAGSAAFFFAIEPQRATLSDLCHPLCAMYGTLQEFHGPFVESFERLCQDFPQPGEEAYYRVRERFNTGELSWLETGTSFLYLNRLSFHGLWRVNAKGHMNVGYGHYPRPPIPTIAAMQAASVVLQGAEVFEGNWDVTATDAGPGDFLYMDPPYLGTWSGYTGEEGSFFTIDGYKKIEETGRKGKERGAAVVVSSRDCPEIRQVFKTRNWHHLPVGVVQKIAPQNGGRRPEMLLIAK